MKKLLAISLRNKKPRVYVFLSLYVLLSVFLVVESCLPGDLSYEQSGGFGNLVALIGNFFSDNVAAKMVEPTVLALSADSTYLSTNEGMPQVGIGTTTRLTYTVSAGTLNKGEYLNPCFMAERNDGTADQGLYNLLVDGSSHAVYIVSVGTPQKNCSITIKAGTNLTKTYSFDIVDLPAPSDDLYTVSQPKSTIKKNESETLSVSLKDAAKNKNDLYLRRYFDVTKLPYASANENIATIDKYGVIRGIGEGTTSLTYGIASFNILVAGAGTSSGDTTALLVAKKNPSEALALNDYDYVGDGSAKTGVVLVPSFSGTKPSDSSITWRVDSKGDDDILQAKIIPNDDGTVGVYGYRKKGIAHIIAEAHCNSAIKATIDLPIEDIIPVSMSLLNGGTAISEGVDNKGTIALSEYNAGEITLSGSFLGPNSNPNVTNKALEVSSSSSDAFVINGNGTSMVTIDFAKEGTANVIVSSVSNPGLSYTLVFTIEGTPNVDPADSGFQLFIRKFFGHGSLFALAAAFGFLFFAFLLEDKHGWMSYLISAGCGLLLALATESIQHFVPGRFGAWKDVGIDVLGFLIGALLTWGIYEFVLFLKSRKKIRKND